MNLLVCGGAGFIGSAFIRNYLKNHPNDKITNLDFETRYVDAIGQNGAAVLGRPRRALYSTRYSGLNNEGVPTFSGEDGETTLILDLQNRGDIEEVLVPLPHATEHAFEPEPVGIEVLLQSMVER